MTNWDQDIHRIQEIQQLLEDRQRLFCGQLANTHYDQNRKNSTQPFSILPSKHSTDEHSLGHSLEANHGSSEGDHDIRAFPMFGEPEESEADVSGDNAETARSSDGHCADHSDYESSNLDTTDDDEGSPKIKKNAKKRRNWVDKNMKKVSKSKALKKPEKPIETVKPIDTSFKEEASPKAGKSVVFSDTLADDKKPVEKKSKKKAKPDPFSFVKKRSWRLRAEIVSRLNGDNGELDMKILNSVTKSTVEYAREKLKKAERSLQKTVDKELLGTKTFMKMITEKPVKPGSPKPAKKTVSRLAIKNSEDAVKSDLNLREIFAMIKIDPSPLLPSALTGSKEGPETRTTRESIFGKTPDKLQNRKGLAGFEDSETTRSLNRLTKLSVQHKQKQKSLVPEQVSRLQGPRNSTGSVVVMSRPTSTKYVPNRRKSSTISVSSQQQTMVQKKSKDNARGPKLAFSSLEAALKSERKGSASADELEHGGVQKLLTGTIL